MSRSRAFLKKTRDGKNPKNVSHEQGPWSQAFLQEADAGKVNSLKRFPGAEGQRLVKKGSDLQHWFY